MFASIGGSWQVPTSRSKQQDCLARDLGRAVHWLLHSNEAACASAAFELLNSGEFGEHAWTGKGTLVLERRLGV